MNDCKHFLFLDGDISVVLMEWLPIGHESIKFLQDKLECAGPDREFFITSNIDRERNASTIDVGKAEIRIRVSDYKALEEVRFIAEVNIESTGSSMQEESIGVCVNRHGGISYGLKLKERDKRTSYSIDELAFVVADMIEDSSIIMDTIFNSYQKRLLDVIYCNQSSERDKFAIVTARTITPEVQHPDELLNNSTYRSELRQLLGSLYHDRTELLTDGTMVIAGENGILLIGDDVAKYSEMLRIYGLMGCIISLQNNIFNRLSWSWDLLYEQKRRVQEEGIDAIMDIQNILCNLSADEGLLLSVPIHLKRAMAKVVTRIESLKENHATMPGGLFPLFEKMASPFIRSVDRSDEAADALMTLGREIQNIRSLASTLSEKETYGINRAMNILTVVSVVILPLTLITGIYGMNFYNYRPSGEAISQLNMPELYWRYGYLLTICMMIGIAGTLLFIFWHKGLLLGSNRARKKS